MDDHGPAEDVVVAVKFDERIPAGVAGSFSPAREKPFIVVKFTNSNVIWEIVATSGLALP